MMLPTTQELVAELDLLYGLYQLALDYTVRITPGEQAEMVKWLDTRQRLLSRTAEGSKNAAKLMRLFEITPNVPANERLLVEEKRALVQETFRQMQRAEHDIMRRMHARMVSIRREMATTSRRRTAILAYIAAPSGAMAMAH